ncbi:MAG: hypothetical protein GY853_01240 [PVC group bacterium]|nr:hypothetical protein [PVC group bacterium]
MKAIFKEMLFVIIVIVLLTVLIVVMYPPNTQPEQKEYQIYSYIENETAVYRYMDNLAVYEYSYNGIHLVQLIKGTEQITIIEYKDRDTAVDFAVSYLEGIKGEE